MINIKSPVKLHGAISAPVWSGHRLSSVYAKFKNFGNIGEAWETSVVEGREAIAEYPGKEMPFSEYLFQASIKTPPLVKIIDTSAPLSIQVHPDDIAAMKHGGAAKSEIWYVLHAQPGAEILYGTKDGVSSLDVKSAIFSGNIESLLCRIPVKAGDIFMIPPGMIHSLGSGITVLEVQNCAGTTYRIKDLAGCRETQPEEAADSFRLYTRSQADAMAFTDYNRFGRYSLPGVILAAAREFSMSSFTTDKSHKDVLLPHRGVYMFCSLGGGISGDISFREGDSLFFGEDDSRVKLLPDSSVLFIA